MDNNNTKQTAEKTSSGKVVRNALFNSSGWAATVIIALIATPYIVHKLTIEGYGIYALLTGLIGYYGLLDLGFGQGVIKFVAQYKAIGDDEAISRSINAALWVQIITGFIGSAALVIFAEPILGFLNVSAAFWADAKIGLYVSAVGFFLTMISGTLSSVLMGLQHYDVTSKVSVATNGILTLTIVGLLRLGYGLREVVYATVFSTLIVFSIYLIQVTYKLPQWNLSLVFDRKYFKTLFDFSGYMFVFRVSSLFINYIVRFIVGAILGPSAVTYYVVPMKVINAFGGLLANITTVLFPFASELEALSNRDSLQRIYITASKYITTVAFPLHLILIFFSREILTLWMGGDFAAQAWLVMSLLSIAYLLSSLTMVPANITLGLGYSKIIAFFSVIVLALGMLFAVFFTSLWGIVGTACGILITQIQAPIFILYITKNLIYLPIQYFLKKVLSFHLIIFLPVVFIFTISQLYLDFNKLSGLILFCTVFVIVYFGMCISLKWLSYHDIIDKIHIQ